MKKTLWPPPAFYVLKQENGETVFKQIVYRDGVPATDLNSGYFKLPDGTTATMKDPLWNHRVAEAIWAHTLDLRDVSSDEAQELRTLFPSADEDDFVSRPNFRDTRYLADLETIPKSTRLISAVMVSWGWGLGIVLFGAAIACQFMTRRNS